MFVFLIILSLVAVNHNKIACSRTTIHLETCQSNPKFETVVLVAKELNISVDTAIFPEMVNKTVSKTVVDFFAGKSEAEIEKFIALCKQAEAFQKDE